MKILIDNKIPFIQGRLENAGEVTYLSPEEFTPERVKDADILLVRTRTRCDRSLLENSTVKLIATATIGFDHIDMEWCGKNGIAAYNSAGCNAPAVAQYVWATLLHDGFIPKESKIGVVGYGNIGSIVADWGRKLGCKVMVNDPPKKDAGTLDCESYSLEEILKEADAVTFHTPLTHTGDYPSFHLLNSSNVGLLKKGARVINAARGGVIEEPALLKAILDKDVRAFIDVWENEPQINTDFMAYTVNATPHIAGYSLQGKQRATEMVIEAVRSGEKPQARKYDFPEISEKIIRNSYNPFNDSLKSRPLPFDFDTIRENYKYRNEILCGVER